MLTVHFNTTHSDWFPTYNPHLGCKHQGNANGETDEVVAHQVTQSTNQLLTGSSEDTSSNTLPGGKGDLVKSHFSHANTTVVWNSAVKLSPTATASHRCVKQKMIMTSETLNKISLQEEKNKQTSIRYMSLYVKKHVKKAENLINRLR